MTIGLTDKIYAKFTLPVSVVYVSVTYYATCVALLLLLVTVGPVYNLASDFSTTSLIQYRPGMYNDCEIFKRYIKVYIYVYSIDYTAISTWALI